MEKLKLPAIIVAAVLLFGVLAAATVIVVRNIVGEPEAAWEPPTPSTEAPPQTLDEYYTQKVEWSRCEGGRCARITVPIDYAKPEGPTLELAVLVIPAAEKASRSMFVNPGGPGASGVDFAERMENEFPSDLRARYDIVGVDPRGTGNSTPLECLSDAQFDAFIAVDPTPDTPGELAEFRQAGRDMAKACDQNSGDLARHVSTAEVARDFDIVRALLGRKTLDYFGASYGTKIGATYATLFPKKVGRMVLDGAVDPSQDAFEGSMAQTVGFQRALSAYVADCVQDAECPLGRDKDAGLRRIDEFLDSVDQRPLPAGDRKLTETHAFIGIAITLYARETWSILTPALEAAINDGNGRRLLDLADIYYERQADGSFASNSMQVISAVNCLDEASNPSIDEVRSRLGEFSAESPVFGPPLGWGALACTDWPDSQTPQVKIDGKGAAPILVLGTTRDPATPYESAVALSKQLASGVLVTRDGDGHTAYVGGPDCIRNVVDDFFLAGKVPPKDPRC